MSKVEKNQATLRFEEIIKSKKYQDYYNQEHDILMVAVMMQAKLDEKNLTQTELAERMGVSQADISKILNGKKKNFTIKTLLKFYHAIGQEFKI